MKEIHFPLLSPEQIEVRVAESKIKGTATILLYIDSRAAADILDQTVGAYNWSMEYKDVAGQIYGRLSIWDEDRQIWVYKEDTGEESNISAAKGLSSDILKRCLARWGCNYLYSSPKIKLTNLPDNYYFNEKMTMTFTVKDIAYEGKKISKLSIVDRWGNEVYSWSKDGNQAPSTPTETAKDGQTNEEILVEFCKQKKAEGYDCKSFYVYWHKRLPEWKGKFDVERLWQKHIDAFA